MKIIDNLRKKMCSMEYISGDGHIRDTDLVKLTEFGDFILATKDNIYRVKEGLATIVENKKPLDLKYMGSAKLTRRKVKGYFNNFQTFSAFKDTYNSIKQYLEERGEKKK